MIGSRGLWALCAAAVVLAGCLGLAMTARAEGSYVFQGGAMSLDLSSDQADFNLVPYQEEQDPDFLFRQDLGGEGDAGLALYLPARDLSFGMSGDAFFSSDFDPPESMQTENGWRVTSHFRVDEPNFNEDGVPPVLLDITQTIFLSNSNQTISVDYAIENVSGGPLRFRPYLLGAPYLLDRSQFESEANSIRSTFSSAPAPTLSMSSTKASRALSVISTGANKADSAQVIGTDQEFDDLSLDLLYDQFLAVGAGFSGPFDTSDLTDPSFGLEWNDWMAGSGLASGQVAEFEATLSFAKPTQGGDGPAAGGVPVSGTVLIKLPNGNFVELQPGDAIPNQSVIDTTKGTIQISTQGGDGSAQTAAFRGGVFTLLRNGSSPLTTLKLTGPLAGCGRRSLSSQAVASGGRGRSLWGSGKGKFRTQGKRGSGSVRGTTWQVTDRCDGSTSIQSLKGKSQGIVDARDFGKPRKRIVLKPGQSYIARPGK